MNDSQEVTVCRSHVGRPLLAGAEADGNNGIEADAKADADGIDEVLHGKDQGHSRHGLFTDHGDEQAVDDIIERIDDHRHDGRQGHRSDERQNRPFFHKRFVHTSPSAAVAQPAPEGSSAFDDQVEDEDIH